MKRLKLPKGWVDPIKLNHLVKTNNVEYSQFDLLKPPYPFKDNTFDLVLADQILEHFTGKQILKIMEELHRVMKNNSKLIIKTPHYSNANGLTSIDHKNFFGVETFHFLYSLYGEFHGRFKPNYKVNLIWKKEDYNGGFMKLIAKIGNRLSNINPQRSERYLGNYIGGFEAIEYEIELIKLYLEESSGGIKNENTLC
jgi:SAM-dependent methyltransferase